MKNSKVKNIKSVEMFMEMYVFEVEFANGDIGKVYRKSNESKLTTEQEVSYTMNDKGSIKIITDYEKNNLSQLKVVSSLIPEKSDEVQKLIVKQSSLKSSVDYNSNCSVEDVLKNAQLFNDWVWELK